MTKELSFSVFVIFFFCLSSSVIEGQVLDITKYGAKADGSSDITQALTTAWTQACAALSPSTVLIPAGTFVLSTAITLQGPCKSALTFQVQGTVQGPVALDQIKGEAWVTVQNIDFFTLQGGGTFDGQGKDAWAKNNCDQSKNCGVLPANLRFNFITNSVIQDITSKDSKEFHIFILGGKNVTLQRLTVTAPGDSPNTDGIHIGRSSGVTITDTKIQTGDDCISLGDGSQQVNITKVMCGPGHGISVGSLGKYKDEEPVSGVFVNNCTLTGTMWGVRIKSWPASPVGSATDMHFEDITMRDVGNPVLIDQGYCPWNQCTAGAPSQIKISKVSFKNIRGSSTTAVAVQLSCSKAVPCEEVEVADINLVYHGNNGTISSVCENVKPSTSGTQNPAICSSTAAAPAAQPAQPA